MNKEDVLKSINNQCQCQLTKLCQIFEKIKIPYQTIENSNCVGKAKVELIDINLDGEIVLNDGNKIYRYHFDSNDMNAIDTNKENDPSQLYVMFRHICKTLMERYQIDHYPKLDKVIPPNNILDWLIIGLVCLPTLCYLNRSILHYLFNWNGYLSSILIPILDDDTVLITIIILEFVTHAIETCMFLVPKLQSYKVPSKLWYRWIIFGVIEGYGPVRRIDNYSSYYDCSCYCNQDQNQNSTMKPLLVVDKEKEY